MKSKYNSINRRATLLCAAMAIVAPTLAWAETPAANEVGEVVVTGTSLRKVAPAGAESFHLDATAITATSAISTDQLLADIPQLNSFGVLPITENGGTQLTVNRTNLRNLPQGVGGGSPTLVLMDGHRLVGEGVVQSYPDPDVIPPALIERVEVVTDGGSATYGADAVGGVVNFITKRDFNGVQAGVREGVGDHYNSTDVNLTVGKAWDRGSFYVGYNYSRHDPLFGRDRSYIRDINYATGLPASRFCSPANVTVGANNYAVVGGNALSLSNANLCDPSQSQIFYPKEDRNSVMVGFHQELTNTLELGVKGYFTQRNDLSDGGPLTGSGTVTSTTPGYISTGGGSTANQTAFFNFAPVGGESLDATRLQSYGITPTLTWKMPFDWQMTAFYNYGQSKTTSSTPQVNNALLIKDIAAGSTNGINPYNISASNAGAIANVLNYDLYGLGRSELSNSRVTFDGPVVKLPGGDLRLAVGGEYIYEKYSGVTATDTFQNVAVAPLHSASREVESGFIELNIPVVGAGNRLPFIYSFSASIADRFDNYSDFGSTWSPSLGATLMPVSWIGLRVRGNEAFQAPSVVQIAQASSPQATVYPNFILTAVPGLKNPAVPIQPNQVVVNVSGTVSPLQPERAKDYNLGFDISPPILPGLDIHFTYYNIYFAGQISAPPTGVSLTYFSDFPNLYIMNPNTSQIGTFLQKAGLSAAAVANTLAQVGSQSVYFVNDGRARNLGITKVDGFDIAFEYHRQVSFGTVFASFNSSYLNGATTAPTGSKFNPNQAGINASRFNSTATFGAKVGENFTGQLTWNHLASFKLAPALALGQTSVSAFNTFDLFTQYDMKRNGLPPVKLSLGITNILDTNPPPQNGIPNYSSSTLGRVFQLGASVKF